MSGTFSFALGHQVSIEGANARGLLQVKFSGKTGPRLGMNLVILLDLSSSMGFLDSRTGLSRLAVCKKAIEALITLLDDQDHLCLVTFWSDTETQFSLSMTKKGKEVALKVVKELVVISGTHLGTGLAELASKVKKIVKGRPNLPTAAILLTDGDATDLSDRELLATWPDLDAPCPIHVMGITYEHNALFLSNLAMTCKGSYNLVSELQEIPIILGGIIGGISGQVTDHQGAHIICGPDFDQILIRSPIKTLPDQFKYVDLGVLYADQTVDIPVILHKNVVCTHSELVYMPLGASGNDNPIRVPCPITITYGPKKSIGNVYVALTFLRFDVATALQESKLKEETLKLLMTELQDLKDQVEQAEHKTLYNTLENLLTSALKNIDNEDEEQARIRVGGTSSSISSHSSSLRSTDSGMAMSGQLTTVAHTGLSTAMGNVDLSSGSGSGSGSGSKISRRGIMAQPDESYLPNPKKKALKNRE